MKVTKEITLAQLYELIKYAKDTHNIRVNIYAGAEDAYYPDDDLIEINSCANTFIKFHTLLHELGHVVIRAGPDYKNLFPHASRTDQRQGTKTTRIDILREEVYAWDAGYQLGLDLGYKISRRRYYNHMFAALGKYVVWTIYRMSFSD